MPWLLFGSRTLDGPANCHTITEVDGERRHMRNLLSVNPPHVLFLVDIPEDKWSYGAFLRGGKSWRFICLNEAYVNLWQEAEDDAERLALTALLRAALDHELGHWVQCVATGTKPQNFKTLINWKCTPTFLNSPWFRKQDQGEAGQWVEFCSRGGIVDYNTVRRKAVLVTGSGRQDLSSSDLDQYRSGTAFPSKIAPREPSSRTVKGKEVFLVRNAGCFQSTHGMTRRGCCLMDTRR